MDYLPRGNDPGCAAGFAHGLVTGVGSDIDPSRPQQALSVCGDAGTRFQRYSCIHGFGHAFMRIYGDRLELALPMCRALGPGSAPDCAQGAYHDYWFAVLGADDATPPADSATNPRELCADQPASFVRRVGTARSSRTATRASSSSPRRIWSPSARVFPASSARVASPPRR
jgi:hypothetical protein